MSNMYWNGPCSQRVLWGPHGANIGIGPALKEYYGGRMALILELALLSKSNMGAAWR